MKVNVLFPGSGKCLCSANRCVPSGILMRWLSKSRCLSYVNWAPFPFSVVGCQKVTGEAKAVPQEGRTYTSLATARARSASEVPWENKRLYQPRPWHSPYAQTTTLRHTMHTWNTHTHTHTHTPASGDQVLFSQIASPLDWLTGELRKCHPWCQYFETYKKVGKILEWTFIYPPLSFYN